MLYFTSYYPYSEQASFEAWAADEYFSTDLILDSWFTLSVVKTYLISLTEGVAGSISFWQLDSISIIDKKQTESRQPIIANGKLSAKYHRVKQFQEMSHGG